MKYTLQQKLRSGEVLTSNWTVDTIEQVKVIAKAWRKNNPSVKIKIIKID